MYKEGVVTGHIIAAVGCGGITFILSLKYGEFKFDKTNTLTLLGVIIGIGFWIYFKSSFLGLILNLLIMFIGSFPTFKSAKNFPEKEDKLTWILFSISCIPAVLAAQFTFAGVIQPLTFFLVEIIVVFFLLFPKIKQKKRF